LEVNILSQEYSKDVEEEESEDDMNNRQMAAQEQPLRISPGKPEIPEGVVNSEAYLANKKKLEEIKSHLTNLESSLRDRTGTMLSNHHLVKGFHDYKA
jgi:hypothetical protein